MVYFFRFYLFIFRQREREGEERKRNIDVWLPLTHPATGDLAHNPGMCSHQESNQQPFGSQASSQSTDPYQSGLDVDYIHTYIHI